jgi:hypothetical protein
VHLNDVVFYSGDKRFHSLKGHHRFRDFSLRVFILTARDRETSAGRGDESCDLLGDDKKEGSGTTND